VYVFHDQINDDDGDDELLGVTVEDFRKDDSGGKQIIDALQFEYLCSVIVHSDRETR